MVIGVPSWPSAKASAYILKEAIEQNFGLIVEMQNGTNPIIFEAMDKGAMHVHPEVWLPNQKDLFDAFVNEKGTVAVSKNGVVAVQGMCIDRGFAEKHGISAIEDLTNPDIAALFDRDGDGLGEVWVGAAGWSLTPVEQIRAKSYGYDQTFELVQIDETLAYADLDNSITVGKPWVGFCYSPHYIFVLHDLIMLEEPEHDPTTWDVTSPSDNPNWLEISEAGSAWEPVLSYIAFSKKLEEQLPDVAKMLDNVAFTNDDISGMSYALVVKGMEAEEFARDWVSDNQDRVINWLTD
jgi:glycine betaine/proline transport system substrate-binding protein